MKKLFIAAGCALLLTACAKNAEQVDVVKAKLKEWKMSDEEIKTYEFKTSEVLDKDFYSILSKEYSEKYYESKDTDLESAKYYIEESGKYVDLAGKASDKKCFIVKAYVVTAGDTIHDKIFYIDDKNAIVDLNNLK
ncbi:hypothetical protein ACLI1A_07065 [Flavobacterium sp. RHBU_3]|uniref:hypothetical protein n=1 Tax=Flavobacterium sp. RHBU_3 TaxID=3391184 RepID=UPI0039854F7F